MSSLGSANTGRETMSTETLEKQAPGVEEYLALHSQSGLDRDADAPEWLQELRRRGVDVFRELGFPTRANEDWKYTDVSPIWRGHFSPVEAPAAPSLSLADITPFLFGQDDWPRLVWVDGVFAGALSRLPDHDNGMDVLRLPDAFACGRGECREHLGKLARPEFSGFSALNAAYLREGACVAIAANSSPENPLHLLYISTGRNRHAAHMRNLLVVGENSSATVVESFFSLQDGEYFTNIVSEAVVASGAHLDYYRVQEESPEASHISQVEVRQMPDSHFACTTLNFGGRLVRNDVNVLLDGQGCYADLNGLTILDGQRHVDNHTAIDHAHPNCESHELYKAILDEKSRGVFNGKIFVRQDAQKTDAKQTNRNLLLSETARMDTKPQLEIFADDVKCTHGATVGQLNEDEVFYLRSRGMDERVARQLLVYGFANDIVERIKPPALRQHLHEVQVRALHTEPEVEELNAG